MEEKKYTVTFETKLTEKFIDELVQHQTMSSLRRAVALSPCIMKADDVENMPTIYYAYNQETDKWEHHALTSDLITYLLKGQAEEGGDDEGEGGDDTPTEPTHDGTIEITAPNDLTSLEPKDGRIDISNEYIDALTENLELSVKITMDEDGTYEGEYFYDENTEGVDMDEAVGKVLTATIEIPKDSTEKGTQINFKVTETTTQKVDTFVIAYGSTEP